MDHMKSERRSFFTAINSRIAALAAMAAGTALAQTKTETPWQPARHDKDDWFDKLPSKHRLVFDTTNADGFGEALRFAGNFIRVNQADYGVPSSELSVVIVARHRSTPFGWNDAIWAKYGESITSFEDPKTKKPATQNVFNATDYGNALTNGGTTVNSILKQGVQLAVCNSATRALAGMIATKAGAKTDDIYAEITSNLLSNARMVPAGIVAVSRAQERGYTLVKA